MSIKSGNSLLNQKIVYDLTPFTHLDYPNHLACIVWFCGCNIRCQYCYNDDIVYSKEGTKTLDEVLDFLKKRVGLLDGVVLSGGEPTTHCLKEFCISLKELGFLVKLDTNGLNYEEIKELLDLSLVDYIALDYKAPSYKFEMITKSKSFNKFSNTLDLLIESQTNFEVRTTIHNDLLNVDDINFIIEDLKQRGYSNTLYLQKFLETDSNIANLHTSKEIFQKEKLNDLINIFWRN